jgi:hypothetical protein
MAFLIFDGQFNFPQPSVYLGHLRIDEPVTVLTDLMVSAVCFYASIRLWKKCNHHSICNLLKFYFLSMGMATAIGGIVGHGFIYLLSFPWKLPGWLTSMFSIMLIERASILYARPLIRPSVGNLFAWLNIIELITFVSLTFISLNFFFVEVHSAYGLLIVTAGFNGFVYYRTRSRGAKYFLIAVGISAISALIFMNKIGFSPWFNHFDISHVLMTASAFMFYRGALLLLKEETVNEQSVNIAANY